jgi:Fur family zinc uptake transcriptional regulator
MSYPQAFITYCATLDLKLTSLRKEILFILWHSHKKPLKAYEILEKLLKTKLNATPPNVYRTLDFFTNNGIIHKIESIQSYTVCSEPIKNFFTEVLMVCNLCHNVIEIYDNTIHDLFKKISNKNLFCLTNNAIEVKGTCNNCHDKLDVSCNNLGPL